MFETENIEYALKIFDNYPKGIVWKDKSCTYRLMNNVLANNLGFKSSKISFEGIRDHNALCDVAELADDFEAQDRYVMENEKEISLIAFCRTADGDCKIFLSEKYPLFNKDNELIGMRGESTDITSNHILTSGVMNLVSNEVLSKIMLGKQKQFTYTIASSNKDFNLSKRESECLFLKTKGMTAKMIARFLGTSKSTVDKQVAKAMEKMHCFSESQLIERALHTGAGNIIPKSLIVDYEKTY